MIHAETDAELVSTILRHSPRDRIGGAELRELLRLRRELDGAHIAYQLAAADLSADAAGAGRHLLACQLAYTRALTDLLPSPRIRLEAAIEAESADSW